MLSSILAIAVPSSKQTVSFSSPAVLYEVTVLYSTLHLFICFLSYLSLSLGCTVLIPLLQDINGWQINMFIMPLIQEIDFYPAGSVVRQDPSAWGFKLKAFSWRSDSANGLNRLHASCGSRWGCRCS